jgi:hypothetical protein
MVWPRAGGAVSAVKGSHLLKPPPAPPRPLPPALPGPTCGRRCQSAPPRWPTRSGSRARPARTAATRSTCRRAARRGAGCSTGGGGRRRNRSGAGRPAAAAGRRASVEGPRGPANGTVSTIRTRPGQPNPTTPRAAPRPTPSCNGFHEREAEEKYGGIGEAPPGRAAGVRPWHPQLLAAAQRTRRSRRCRAPRADSTRPMHVDPPTPISTRPQATCGRTCCSGTPR